MTESVLKAILRLYALVAQLNNNVSVIQTRSIVETYLRQLISADQVRSYLIIYDFYYRGYKEGRDKLDKKLISVFSVKAIIICEQINKVIEQKEKALVVVNLFELVNLKSDSGSEVLDFLRTVSLALKFKEDLFQDSRAFILNQLTELTRKRHALVISEDSKDVDDEVAFIRKQFLKGKLVFLYVSSIKTILFRYLGESEQLYLNGRDIAPYKTYVLDKGASIRSPKLSPIYYSDISRKFILKQEEEIILFQSVDVQFKFKNSENGIRQFTMNERSGRLIGIMGGSGVGKSTLLNVLNGNLKPVKGNIYINGFDIHENKDKTRGLIGYIPQDDLLIEELTVFENLFYNARLCFKQLNDDEITRLVNDVLNDLDLTEASDLKVGNPLNKFISGGQRKRLNIALELIREPFVLFVDEPTSGLSSHDSDRVMDLLKEQTQHGKLVMVNIHQPSSDIFKMFDKLIVLDKGGYIIYQGNPIDAVTYFKTQNNLINSNESECLNCGNVNPEQVLQIIESTEINDEGKPTGNRVRKPHEWYELYKDLIESRIKPTTQKFQLPVSFFSAPNPFKQFKIFGIRNLLTKLSDRQYLLINLLEAPLLAFILGLFTRYNAGTEDDPKAYIFSLNENFPVYLFMSVIVALFLGLIVSAEEIIRDRKLLKREAFLNLSRFSYFNAKVVFLIVLSAVQSFTFVIIGNAFLEVKGMLFHYWLVLFACSVFSNTLGLNISSSLKSVVAIYILVPLLLVPQILFGGAMLKFDKLNKSLTSQKQVPIIGELMPSRWAYEALAVHQFKYNGYEKHVFPLNQKESDASFKISYLIPELQNLIYESKRNIRDNKNHRITENNLEIVKNELTTIIDLYNIPTFAHLQNLALNAFDLRMADETLTYLNKLKKFFADRLKQTVSQKDEVLDELGQVLPGEKSVFTLRQDFYNEQLATVMLNKNEREKIVNWNQKLIQKAEPIYKIPALTNGRAHFYAPVKRIGPFTFETYWYNLAILGLMSLFFYLLLIFDALNRLGRKMYIINLRNILKMKPYLFKSSIRYLSERFGNKD
ncbi:MAG: ATP-binding cassette domain-containing protein [Bacteroidetes bacterium]|jgi:ABC-type multidrug transport system ATPase subunit|nr:ATP-binding cassette domain-containing protein [Bacteroidota bacterium]